MKKVLALAVLCVSTNVLAAQPKVAYGEDNRIDIVDSRNAMRKNLASSTATQVKNSNLTLSEDGASYGLKNETLEDFILKISRSWWNPEGTPLCKGEKFANQLSIGNCSGFLVGNKYLVTAGHCMTSEADCSGFKWVFDFKKGEVEDLSIEANKVYSCKTIVSQKLTSSDQMDYALIELDKEVEGREPLKFRTEGKIGLGEGVFVIGSPSGLPLKISGDSTVQANSNDVYFDADLDTFGGNSGSAVFNARSGEVEGILVRGARDYTTYTQKDEDGNDYECMGVNYCEDGVSGYGCGGEAVTRITNVEIEKKIEEFEASQVQTPAEDADRGSLPADVVELLNSADLQ
ncbi:putative exported protease [Halobacteriovorax marinus SJ]|uniref:Exported protease n=1 Tax=Halobacteriovorax marinus (strain ATCC BAA-682 / DSM 15412 / SJ) TaxID=862908 RepID=E1X526_HALMS|nr:serine protease [Halobacteriovorax marinus]CBW25497.1 putative exported protease [Halobacteriovorax marinus SJ]